MHLPVSSAAGALAVIGLAVAGPVGPARPPEHVNRLRLPETAYVAGDLVVPISTATNRALKPIKVGPQPFGIAITPNGKTAYVLNDLSDSVTPIRIATNRALRAVNVGASPVAIAITPDGKTVYVVNESRRSSSVTPIRTATNRALKEIKVGLSPVAIVITP